MKRGGKMINVTKSELLRFFIKVFSMFHEDWPYRKVREEMEKLYSSSIPATKEKTDRFTLGGYLILLEKEFSYQEIADPKKCPDMNLMFPKSGVRLFLHDQLLAHHHDPAIIEDEIEQIKKDLKNSPKYSRYFS